MAYADIDSNKVLNKEGLLELSVQIKNYINTNIPSPYTLPTASTTTLGGVKIDGSTITVDGNGVISASGGGATYTAGDNITISNNVISASVPMNLQVNTVQTGTGANNYFQCQKFRGEGDANTYYHAIDFGYAGHNQVDFHEYGGIYTFYQNAGGSQAGGTELLKITPSDITYKGQSLLGSTYTLPTASTSVLGGVKVDGSTITISNGVISAVGGGSSQTTNLPTTPSADGTYLLKCVISSGASSYSWESVSVGGSY